MSDANRLPPLGYPWDALLAAARRMEAADRAAMAAGTAGDLMAKCAAELDRDRAVADFHAVKGELALQWLAGMREALQRYPVAVAELLAGAPPVESVTDALRELEERVDAVEDVAVELKLNR